MKVKIEIPDDPNLNSAVALEVPERPVYTALFTAVFKLLKDVRDFEF